MFLVYVYSRFSSSCHSHISKPSSGARFLSVSACFWPPPNTHDGSTFEARSHLGASFLHQNLRFLKCHPRFASFFGATCGTIAILHTVSSSGDTHDVRCKNARITCIAFAS